MSRTLILGFAFRTAAMISRVVPRGSPQNTASRLAQSTFSHSTSFGRSSMKKCGNTSPIDLPEWVLAVSAVISACGCRASRRTASAPVYPEAPRMPIFFFELIARSFEASSDCLAEIELQRRSVHRFASQQYSISYLSAKPSISRMFCTAAPDAPLPRLSSRATRTAWRCFSLAQT